MSVLPHNIYRDLSGEIRGDVEVGLPVRAIYSTAACIYRIMPMAIVRPYDTEDAAKAVRYATERGVPITPRGGGSGVAGHSIGPGVILDLSTYMNGIIAEGDDWIEVQPGIILDKLNAHLAKRGKRFSPDPSSGAYCTIGGMIANNSSGARGLRFGSTRNHVLALEFIAADGRIVRTDSDNGWLEGIKRGLGKLLNLHRADIETHRPRVTKNSSGYGLWDIGDSDDPDIARLIVGSEGTLAVVTSARLRVEPLPAETGAALLHFSDVRTATGAVPRIRESLPTAIEIMDAAFLNIVREARRDLRDLMPDKGLTMLLVEHEANDRDELRERLARTERAGRSAGAERADTSADAAGVKRLWAVRKAGSPIISSLRGPKRPLRFVEDMVVPPERLHDFAGSFIEILRRNDCVAPVIGHAGDGNVHVNPLLNLRDPAVKTIIRRVADDVYALVDRFGGSLSGEHGDGRLRAPYLKNHYGSGVYRAFWEIKSLFDPKGIFNPGVILGESSITDNLRYGVSATHATTIFDDPHVREIALHCHGCGECRDDCPVFRVTLTEEMSPRGRVSLALALDQGAIPVEAMRNDAAASAAINACLTCARCEAGCSSGVEIPELVSRLKNLSHFSTIAQGRQSVLKNPRSAFAPLSRFHPVTNALMKIPALSGLIYAAGRLNPERPMPAFQGPSLKRIARKYTADMKSADVIYFPGCYATFIDPVGVGHSVLFILESLGLKPRIATFGCCGSPMLAQGDIRGAEESFATTVAALQASPSVPIIASCPSCLRMLRRGVPTIAHRLRSAESFIEEHLSRLDNPNPDMRIAIQIPCHQRSTADAEAVGKLLSHIKGLSVLELPDLCCGMGGTTGMMAENRKLSGSIAGELLDALEKSGATAVVSSCGSCRIALGTVLKDMHPITLIALALGLKEAVKA